MVAARWIAATAVALLSALASPAVHAHSLDSPSVVRADRDATFHFEVIFNVGPGDERLSQYSVIGLDNVGDVDYDADGRCVDLLPAGSEVVVIVSGPLVDPGRSGRVKVRLETCGLSGSQTVFEVEIDVVPFRRNTIFWIESGAIYRASFEGDDTRQVLTSVDADADDGYLALDPIDGQVIWTAYESFQASLRRADLFGQTIQPVAGGGKNGLGGLAVDLAGRNLYSADPSDCIPLCGSVTRLRVDGTNPEHVISLDTPVALDAGVERDTLCWSDGWNDWVQCSTLTGDNVRTVAESVAVDGVALDPVLDKVFWADRQDATIRRADTDGSNSRLLIDEGLVQPRDLAVDPVGRKIYWSDPGSGKLQRATLDGEHVEDVVTGLSDPAGITLLFGQGLIELEFQGEQLRWSAVAGVAEYDVVLGSLRSLRSSGGDYAAATRACAAGSLAATELDTSSSPHMVGGTWWLVRGVTTTGKGTYGSAGLAQSAERDTPVSGSGEDCP